MRRRDFLGAAVGVSSWPLVASAQTSGIPTIGYLSSLSEAQSSGSLAAFRRGLSEVGYLEGQNIAIDFRWAEGQYERLPGMARELVSRRVSIFLAQAPPAALAAKAATAEIPIVFVIGIDPTGAGLVASLHRPGGNATGMTLISATLGQKRLEVVRELLPKAAAVALLVNPLSPDTGPEIASVQPGAQALGLRLMMFNASAPNEIETAFIALADRHPDALLVGTDAFLLNRRDDIVARAASLKIPAIYPFREFALSGGLISYGTNIANSYRQAGIYTGRILKGDKPADLPVMQPTVFELVINMKTANELGIDIPATLHARSNEVID